MFPSRKRNLKLRFYLLDVHDVSVSFFFSKASVVGLLDEDKSV